MKRLLILFLMSAVVLGAQSKSKKRSKTPTVDKSAAQRLAESEPQRILLPGQPYGPMPDFKARKVDSGMPVPFQTKESAVAAASASVNSNASATSGGKADVMDVRQFLQGRVISAVSMGTVPMVMIDGEVFAVGDTLDFSNNNTRSATQAATMRLKKILPPPTLKLVVELVSGSSGPVEFEFELPRELREMF